MRITGLAAPNWQYAAAANRRSSSKSDFANLLQRAASGSNTDRVSLSTSYVKGGNDTGSTSTTTVGGSMDEITNALDRARADSSTVGVTNAQGRAAMDDDIVEITNVQGKTVRINRKAKYDPNAMRGFNGLTLSDVQNPMRFNFENLTDELAAVLREKYPLEDLKINSQGFYLLLCDLKEAGVVSHVPPYIVPPNSSVACDSEGTVTSILTWYPGAEEFSAAREANAMDYLQIALGVVREDYQALMEKEVWDEDESLFVARYDSQQELLKLLERLYPEKVEQKTES